MAFEKLDDAKKVLSEIINRINEDRRRIRLIEQNIDRIESSISSLENNALARMGEIKVALDRVNNKLSETSNRMIETEAELSRLGKLVKKAASKAELKQLEKFIDLINPITSKFVTKDELERALEEKVRRKTQI